MYLTFYNLSVPPFHITPDPKFLYLSPSHKEALAAIIYGIEQRKGFVAIIGGVGVGKTTILRSYLQSVQKKRLKIIYIFNAMLTFQELLKAVYRELGLTFESDDTTEMANGLYEFLIDEYQAGNSVVLVIDEAQNMPVDTLENLRMLSNFETPTDKLIQIVLVGQPEFAELLDSDRLRPLKQRLAIRSTILPLTKKESLEYMKFRLSKAGSSPERTFKASALKRIIDASMGIPRIINILCDNALITGFGYHQKPITKKIATEVIRDLKGVKPLPLFRRWLIGTSALALLILGVMWLMPYQESVLGRIKPLVSAEQGRSINGGDQNLKEEETKGTVAAHRSASGAPAPETVDQKAKYTGKGLKETAQPHTAADGPASSSAPNKPSLTKRTVARGDSLSKLAQQTYGNFNADIMNLIRKENPHITNPNLILAGTTIALPKVTVPERKPDND
ncbi:MAG TPA: AAA family ATPase [Syntrophorhabdaceae bacterium]|jgi:general secretion pathway protein A